MSWTATEVRISLASFVSACAWFLAIPTGGFGGAYEAPAIARSLVLSGRFADPFIVPTGPTAHVAPLFPWFLAALIRIFGKPEWIVIAAIVTAAAASAVLLASLPALSEIFLGRRQPGVCGAVAAILIPFLPLYPNWDANFAAASIAVFILATYRLVDKSPAHLVLAGIFAGLIALLNPITCLAACCAFLLLAARRRRAIRSLPVFIIALLATIGPWVYRNWVVFGRLIPVRDNLGMELSVYNGDRAPGDTHPSTSTAEAARMRAMGEGAYNEARFRQASAWIQSHPKAFAGRTMSRIADFWFPPLWKSSFPEIAGTHVPEVSPIYSASAWLLTLLAAPGLILARRRAFFAALLAVCPLVYYVTSTSVRYRSPVMWVLLLLAGLSLDWALCRLDWALCRAGIAPRGERGNAAGAAGRTPPGCATIAVRDQ